MIDEDDIQFLCKKCGKRITFSHLTYLASEKYAEETRMHHKECGGNLFELI